MRANADECEFANFPLKIGNGQYPTNNDGLVQLPLSLIVDSDIVSGQNSPLAPKNEHGDKNKRILDRFLKPNGRLTSNVVWNEVL